MTEVERRYTLAETGRAELRAEGELRKIGGYASVFNKQSRNLGGFVEVVNPTAFNKSRGDGWPDVVARFNHEDNMLLGTTGARTLQLSIDDWGLSYLVTPPQSRKDILELVERGDVSKSSFAFRAVEDDWSLTDQNFPLRTLIAVQLVDIAPVVSPAYADTDAGVRTAAALRSLAEHLHASLEEVQKLAAENELRRFFVRTDKTTGKKRPEKATTYGPAARMAILGKEADPWAS
jgi:HK97 family phage prohead protease